MSGICCPLSVYSFEDTHYMYLDDISLSNAQTTEHNVLGPGVIGHVLRHRTINPATYVATDKWFAYDQVGSVIGELNSGGLRTAQHFQDAFGNVLESWNTGLWNGGADGFHHNTDGLDADVGAYQMSQRWYNSATGTFTSPALFPPYVEPAYSFAWSRPGSLIDPAGLIPKLKVGTAIRGGIAGGVLLIAHGCWTRPGWSPAWEKADGRLSASERTRLNMCVNYGIGCGKGGGGPLGPGGGVPPPPEGGGSVPLSPRGAVNLISDVKDASDERFWEYDCIGYKKGTWKDNQGLVQGVGISAINPIEEGLDDAGIDPADLPGAADIIPYDMETR